MLRRGPGPLFDGEKENWEKKRRMSLRKRDRQQVTQRQTRGKIWMAGSNY